MTISLCMIALAATVVLATTAYAFSINLANYTVTFNQDFTTMKTLSVTDWGPSGPDSIWIAHKPDGEDWVDFYNPTAPYLPFNIGDGILTIRAGKTNITGKPQYFGGMLSSVDPLGRGFSQQYGYFEMSAKLPLGLGGWPAFWLMDTPGLVNKSTVSTYHELDILEEYGDNPGILHATLHLWSNDSSKDWGYGYVSSQCSMTTGYHTYGLDLQPDFLTFYYDRQMIVRTPNTIPGDNGKYDRPMFVMVNMAYGGGGNLNNQTNLDYHSLDMLVQYVRVWQGSGGSVPSNSTIDATQISYATADFTLVVDNRIDISGVSMLFTQGGNWILQTSNGKLIWQSKTNNPACAITCAVKFQNDGNMVMIDDNGKVFWASNTWGNNEGSLTFLNQDPYLQIFDEQCNVMWTTHNTTNVDLDLVTPLKPRVSAN